MAIVLMAQKATNAVDEAMRYKAADEYTLATDELIKVARTRDTPEVIKAAKKFNKVAKQGVRLANEAAQAVNAYSQITYSLSPLDGALSWSEARAR
jgi:division protein CdvB (Snf7/Vps24/ESCRT-III family)